MSKSPMRTKTAFIITGFSVVVFFFLSICVGRYSIPITQLGSVLLGQTDDVMMVKVFWSLRLPRTIMSLLAGAGLGLAGSVYQTIFKNPLASPDIIGISSGANMGAAIAIVLIGNTMASVSFGAFLGGIAALAFVMLIVKASGANTTASFVLSGIVIGAIAKAVIMLLKYFADSESTLAAIEYWTMGSLASVTAKKLLSILPFWIIGFVGLLLLHRQIGLLALSEDECRSLGVRLRPIRIVVLFLSTLLVSSIVSLTGLISFAGLIAPHIARLMIRQSNTKTMILSALVGGSVLLISDILARCLLSSGLPISILTTVIGVPILIYFMCQKKEGRV